MTRTARRDLADDFATTLAADFAQHGKTAIATLRETKLDTYLRLVAAIEAPAEANTGSPLEGLTDDELEAMLAAVRGMMGER
jgi:hypothetical protein